MSTPQTTVPRKLLKESGHEAVSGAQKVRSRAGSQACLLAPSLKLHPMVQHVHTRSDLGQHVHNLVLGIHIIIGTPMQLYCR